MKLLVADASALVEYLLQTPAGRKLSVEITDAGTDLHVPALCDVEVAAALRALEQRAELSMTRAREAVDDYLELPLVRHGHAGLLGRVFALRHNFSACDAVYVALAEALGAVFRTADRPLESAVAQHTDVDLAG